MATKALLVFGLLLATALLLSSEATASVHHAEETKADEEGDYRPTAIPSYEQPPCTPPYCSNSTEKVTAEYLPVPKSKP